MVTIAMDAKGRDAIEPLVAAAKQRHPSLIDSKLEVAELFDARNAPAAFWIDETGRIVRANDPVYAQRRNRETGEVSLNNEYLDAVREWVNQGSRSVHIMDSDRLAARLPTLEFDHVLAAAHFHLGTYLALHGQSSQAVEHFKRAHTLRPDNWTYKRQAWNLGDIERDYATTFQDALKDPAAGPFYPSIDLDG